ncbi:hypothetical protein [Chryseobacterium sp. YR221]|uniref:hypothetical protein n=1 Tax=Chryseobacterium sp. YR221 TaxID=1500293 RepID=UPI0009D85480|nr:hypothetical protein [Chryseobacterium sp. YR221]SMC32168.1 hypothetical protein SAMN02787074_0270 [Chryseobacterium sp. YR221]
MYQTMELDFRKLLITKLFDFSKEEETLIFKVYDTLFEIYNISVIEIENSPYHQFISDKTDLLKTPKICYYITNKSNTTSFYLFIINRIGTTFRGARSTDKEDTLEIWGLKKLEEDFEFISIHKKKISRQHCRNFQQPYPSFQRE